MIVSPLLLLSSAVVIATVTLLLMRAQAIDAILFIIACEEFGPAVALPHTTLTAAKIALLTACIAVAGDAVRSRTRRAVPIRMAPGARATLSVLAVVMFATAATYGQAQFPGAVVRETAKAGEYLLVAALVCFMRAGRAEWARFVTGLALITVVVTIVALAGEWLGTGSVFLARHHLVPRIAGPLEGPNQLAGFLGLTIPILYATAAASATVAAARTWPARQWLLLTTVFFGAVALVLTFSRAGIFATIAAIAIIGWFRIRGANNKTKSGFVAASGSFVGGLIIGFGAAWVLAGSSFSHFGTVVDAGATGGVGHRSALWHAALIFWHRSPWLGIGAGNFERELASVGLRGVRTHANSLYLQSLAEGGVGLFAATCASVVVPLIYLGRTARIAAAACGAFAAGTGLALHNLVDTLTFYPKIGLIWWIIATLALRVRVGETTPAASPDPNR